MIKIIILKLKCVIEPLKSKIATLFSDLIQNKDHTADLVLENLWSLSEQIFCLVSLTAPQRCQAEYLF